MNFKSITLCQICFCRIVNESGASVWSVSKDAQIEFPNLDPNLRSAGT